MTFEQRTVRQVDTDTSPDTEVARTRDTRVVETAAPAVGRMDHTVTETRVEPSGGEIARRFIVLIFGIIQILIAARIVLLLLAARQDNGLVNFIYQASQLFVAPFEGIFRTDALRAGRSILDIAAVAAFVGWTLLEAILVWVVNLFRREPTI
jgi:hypothetical protein